MKYSIYIIWRNWQIVLSLQPVPHTRLRWRETTLPLIWKQLSSPCSLPVRTIGIIILSTAVHSYKAPSVYPVLLQALFIYFFPTMLAAQLLAPFYRGGNWASEAGVAKLGIQAVCLLALKWSCCTASSASGRKLKALHLNQASSA